VLLLTRDAVIDQLGEIIVAPVTRTIRGIAAEVVLTTDDGMPSLGLTTIVVWASAGCRVAPCVLDDGVCGAPEREGGVDIRRVLRRLEKDPRVAGLDVLLSILSRSNGLASSENAGSTSPSPLPSSTPTSTTP
jgi:hypothetical protein